MRFQSSRSPTLRQTPLFCTAFAIACMPAGLAAAPKLTTLYTFKGGTDGNNPYTETLVPGPNGSLYGATRISQTSGAVFQLSQPANGGTPWTYTLLQSFTGDQNGGRPAGLMAGPAGSLIGEALNGGNSACEPGCGLIFQLSPPTDGQTAWTETILYPFAGGADGAYPRDGLVQDGQGNLFGTTLSSGVCGAVYGCGTVFELSPPAMGQTTWTLTTLYTFADEKPGYYPAGKLLPDQSGGFYGITWGGGKDGRQCYSYYIGCGTVYHLTPPGKKMEGWKKTTLYRLGAYPDGQTPFTTLNLDAAGNLYGMTMNGGLHAHCRQIAPGGCGTLFELSPPAGGKGAWTYAVPWEFTGGIDGRQPTAAGLTPFKGGYITTTAGNEVNQFGSIDLFTPGTPGQPWTEQTLFTFTDDANGENPASYLLEENGVLYGMTRYGSSLAPYGTVFSFKP